MSSAPRSLLGPAASTERPLDGATIAVPGVREADALSGLAPGSFRATGAPIPDIVVTRAGSASLKIQLRAGRSRKSNNRVYNLTATAGDVAGNTATATAICSVRYKGK